MFQKSKNSYTLRSGKISYSTCRDIFKETLTAVGENPSLFGLHSLRAGGGGSAAAAVGVPDHLFKKHGRWLSDPAKDGYVHCKRIHSEPT